jgi:competence protein ComEC
MRVPLGFLGAGAFVLGVALYSTSFLVPAIALISGIGLCIAIWQWDWRPLAFLVAILILVGLGFLRVSGGESFPEAPDELTTAGEFSARILDVPRRYPTSAHTRLDILEPLESRVWGSLPPYPDLRQGDLITIQGRFTPNEATPFRGFAAQRDTTGVLSADTVSVTGNEATTAQRWRAEFGEHAGGSLRQRIPEPAGAFATGVLLGDDGAMTESTRDAFRVGGLTHMTAVSGVHVGIVAAGLLLISNLGLVNKWIMLVVSVPVVWSFAYLVGMRPSVVRASLMLTLLVIALLLGRPRDTLNAVGLAAAAMLLWDPSFRHDVGFQLSVAATCGIAIGILLTGSRSHWHLVWVIPLAAQLATEPLILYHFGYYSLVSPLANILATPFLAFTMTLGLPTIGAGFVSSWLADLLAMATWLPAMAVVTIADYAAEVPYLSDDVAPLSLAGVWSVYAILIGLIVIAFICIEPEAEDHHPEFGAVYRV